MTSIFELKTSVDELKMSNSGMADMKYEQVTSRRGPLKGDDFPGSQIQMDWEMGPDRWWIPSRSYMRIRCKLTKGNGIDQLTMADNIAPNMGLASNLFQKLEFKINNNTVSTIAENVPLIDALHNRQTKSKSWLDGTGASFNWWTADQKTRQSQVSEDGTLQTAGGSSGSITLSRTDLGFDAAGGAGNDRNAAKYTAADGNVEFKQNGGAGLPADVRPLFPIGSYLAYPSVQGGGLGVTNVEMEVIGHVDAENITVRAVVGQNVDEDGRTDFVRIDKQISVADSRRVDGFEIIWQPPLSIFGYGGALPVGRYTLLLTPQPKNSYQRFAIESTSAGKTPGVDFKFEVENMFMYVCTAQGPTVTDQDYVIDLETVEAQETQFSGASFQSQQFTVSPSTYQLTCAFQDSRVGTDTLYSASKFKIGIDDDDLKLSRFHIQYAGKVLPSPDYDGFYKAGNYPLADFTSQMYAETQIYTGAVFSEGSSETIEDWQKRGPYYSFMWPKSEGDASTRALVYYQFDASAALTKPRVILFAHSRKVAIVQIRNGMVQTVITQDA